LLATLPPRVSVLIPARDAARTITPCLRSVQRQSETAWECVVIDDGSDDDTAGTVERFADRDPRFRLVRRDRRGLVDSLNDGVARCRASWIARMDADDLMHRRRLQDQLDLLRARPRLDAVGTHVRLFPRAALGPGMRAYEAWLNAVRDTGDVARERWIECPVAHPTLTIRTALLRAAPYRRSDWPEDYDLILRLLRDGRSIGVVPRRRHAWRVHSRRLSRSDERYGSERFTRCKAYDLARTVLAGVGQYALWGYGHTGRALRAALADEGRRVATIVEVHPGRVGNVIHGAPVIAPDALDRRLHTPLIVSVAGAGPRARIRSFLAARGFVELRDFVCAA